MVKLLEGRTGSPRSPETSGRPETLIADQSADDPDLRAAGDSDGPTDVDASLQRFDGRGRRRQAFLVVCVALLTGVAGLVVGSQVRSPADEAAARRPPVASRITVPVVRQQLQSSLVLSGEVQFSDPEAIRLGGSVGVSADEAQVITRIPEVDQVIAEGDVAFEVSGRPVIFLEGNLPMYRRLNVGMEGADVAELEVALERLGYPTGTADTMFDDATAAAVALLYADAGYVPEGPTDEQRESLRLATESVSQTEQASRDAQAALAAAANGRPPSELLALQQSVDAAHAAVPIAQQQAANDNVAAQQAVTTAQTDLGAATSRRDAAAAMSNGAARPGAIDPDTGAEFTALRRQELADEAALAQRDRATAEQAVIGASNALPVVKASGDSQVRAATDAEQLARAQLAEAKSPIDTAPEQANLAAATKAATEAVAQLTDARAAAGLRVSPGEILFLPVLPTTVTEIHVALGFAVTDQLGTVSSADTTVVAGISRADSGVVDVGAKVTIEMRDIDLEVAGTVLSVGQPRPVGDQRADDGSGQQADQGASSGRLQVVIAPDDPAALRDQVYGSAKIRIDVGSTAGDVLVVPVAALTVGPDGVSRVLVETSPVTADSPGTTVSVPVEVGLSTQGLAEIRPLDVGALGVGDSVVVGTETNERRGENSTDQSSEVEADVPSSEG